MVVYLIVRVFPYQQENGPVGGLTYPNGAPKGFLMVGNIPQRGTYSDSANVPKEWKEIIVAANADLCTACGIRKPIPIIRQVFSNPLTLEFRNFKERESFLRYAERWLAYYFPPQQVRDEFKVVLLNNI